MTELEKVCKDLLDEAKDIFSWKNDIQIFIVLLHETKENYQMILSITNISIIYSDDITGFKKSPLYITSDGENGFKLQFVIPKNP